MAGKRRFNNLVDVKRYFSSLINRVEGGDLDPNISGKLGFLANSLAKVIENSDLEKRVKDLEEKFGGKKR